MSNMATVISRGEVLPNRKNADRVSIVYKGKIAVITFRLRGTDVASLLTAFYAKK